ncbi:MAG: type II toxin-antitoxin system PemK/MazF family toxin [Isosphaeraceae bacterium]
MILHWIELPPGTGHEQSGRRPAVVVQESTTCSVQTIRSASRSVGF